MKPPPSQTTNVRPLLVNRLADPLGVENSVYVGGALQVLRLLPDESVDMCITSPPYWGLRDYGHDDQLGLEPDFRDFITNLADIFDEVKRVLKPEGTCWVNLGDTYLNDAPVRQGAHEQWNPETRNQGVLKRSAGGTRRSASRIGGVSQKSLCNIPNRFAIEMTDRGWILRNEIIWHKPNPMPQSVKDRFTVDFEKLFFFTKEKRYYFEQQLEALALNSDVAYRQELRADRKYDTKEPYTSNTPKTFNLEARNKRAVWTIPTRPFADAHFAVYPEALTETPIKAGCPEGGIVLDPFFGSGTTGLVALKQGKRFIGIELNPEYAEMAAKRLRPLLQQQRLAV